MFAPIIFFAYNRPEHTRQSLESLKANAEAQNSCLYIFCDGPKTGANEETRNRIHEVRSIVHEQSWCGEVQIVGRTTNTGLAASVMEGVTNVLNRHDRCIVLEDDLEVSPFFLKYMNDALNEYADNNRVISVHGYTYPVQQPLPETFFLRGADCWGWATWKRGWQLFEPDGRKLLSELKRTNQLCAFNYNNSYNYAKMLQKQIRSENDSWAIRWYASAFLNDKLTLYPGRSLVKNAGADGLGTHVGVSASFDVPLSEHPVKVGGIPVSAQPDCQHYFEQYFRKTQTSPLQRLLMRLKY
jgi:hypothetical protein